MPHALGEQHGRQPDRDGDHREEEVARVVGRDERKEHGEREDQLALAEPRASLPSAVSIASASARMTV